MFTFDKVPIAKRGVGGVGDKTGTAASNMPYAPVRPEKSSAFCDFLGATGVENNPCNSVEDFCPLSRSSVSPSRNGKSLEGCAEPRFSEERCSSGGLGDALPATPDAHGDKFCSFSPAAGQGPWTAKSRASMAGDVGAVPLPIPPFLCPPPRRSLGGNVDQEEFHRASAPVPFGSRRLSTSSNADTPDAAGSHSNFVTTSRGVSRSFLVGLLASLDASKARCTELEAQLRRERAATATLKEQLAGRDAELESVRQELQKLKDTRKQKQTQQTVADDGAIEDDCESAAQITAQPDELQELLLRLHSVASQSGDFADWQMWSTSSLPAAPATPSHSISRAAAPSPLQQLRSACQAASAAQPRAHFSPLDDPDSSGSSSTLNPAAPCPAAMPCEAAAAPCPAPTAPPHIPTDPGPLPSSPPEAPTTSTPDVSPFSPAASVPCSCGLADALQTQRRRTDAAHRALLVSSRQAQQLSDRVEELRRWSTDLQQEMKDWRTAALENHRELVRLRKGGAGPGARR